MKRKCLCSNMKVEIIKVCEVLCSSKSETGRQHGSTSLTLSPFSGTKTKYHQIFKVIEDHWYRNRCTSERMMIRNPHSPSEAERKDCHTDGLIFSVWKGKAPISKAQEGITMHKSVETSASKGWFVIRPCRKYTRLCICLLTCQGYWTSLHYFYTSMIKW
jgi:hypothetical protein